MRFKDKVAIVTGSSRNIGRSIVLRLAREGASVVVHGATAARVETVRAEVAATRAPVLAVVADIGRASEAEHLVAQTLSTFGRLDILVNNAAVVGVNGPFLELTPDAWDRIIQVNLGGMFYCSLYAARAMVRHGGGCIINISSVGGTRAHRNQGAYDASKGGIEAATRVMAIELAPHRIRVNTVSPGLVRTDRWERMTEEQIARRRRVIPLEREGLPEDTAGAVAFLCSDEAAYITGQNLCVDGGLLAQLRSPEAELDYRTKDRPAHRD